MKKTQALTCSAAIALTLVAYLCFNSGATAAKSITASTNGKKSKTIADDQFWQHDATTSPIADAQAPQLNRNWWEKTLRQAPLETPGAAGTQNGTVSDLARSWRRVREL